MSKNRMPTAKNLESKRDTDEDKDGKPRCARILLIMQVVVFYIVMEAGPG